LHAPLASQLWLPVQVSGSSAAITATHTPPEPVQAWHVPHAGTPQQRPSTQLPDAQVGAASHTDPLERFASQMPAALQNSSDGQDTPPTLQALAQRVASMHAPLTHTAGAPARQLPAPSQTAALVATPAWQLAAPQAVCAAGKTHAVRFAPSQVPPHTVPAPAHAARVPRGLPVTAVHAPFMFASPQDWHLPVQADSQQTPSTQNPDAHSSSFLQSAP